MLKRFKILVVVLSFAICALRFGVAHAATLQSASDTLSISKPAVAAIHTIKFTTVTQIPASGKIIITFSGTGSNFATPSATTFAFNGLSSSSIQTTNATCSYTISAPSITCTTSTSISAGTTITMIIGGTNGVLINPTQTATSGRSDVWSARIKTQDSSSNDLDTVRIYIAISLTVSVKARVDQILTLSVTGINDTAPINSGNPNCLDSETTNTGSASSSTSINLGKLTDTPSSLNTKIGNLSGQLVSVTTNARNGYVLSTTSRGHLQQISSGFALADSINPNPFPQGSNWFGLHACGRDTTISLWNSGSDSSCNTVITGSSGNVCKYGWPTNTNSLILAQKSSGPVGNDIAPGSGLTSVSYAAGIDGSVQAGIYKTTIRYTVLPSF